MVSLILMSKLHLVMNLGQIINLVKAMHYDGRSHILNLDRILDFPKCPHIVSILIQE